MRSKRRVDRRSKCTSCEKRTQSTEKTFVGRRLRGAESRLQACNGARRPTGVFRANLALARLLCA